MTPELAATIVEPSAKATTCVILLHGLGASSDDLIPIADALQLNKATRFIFPQAPQRAITINDNMIMPGWYDIYGFDFNSKQDKTGIEQSCQAIFQIIEQQIIAGIAAENIVLGGFSQGGAIALYAAISYQHCLAGAIGLSTYLPIAEQIKFEQILPIFLAHGLDDNVVPLSFAEVSRTILSQKGYPLTWHTYQHEHSISQQELLDMQSWLNQLRCFTQ